ncbi:MAG: agmatine deiminase family protein [Cyanobacteriota bacterium]|nr:agmatine deiminase family protein [Cyanobacteriota bacterium]
MNRRFLLQFLATASGSIALGQISVGCQRSNPKSSIAENSETAMNSNFTGFMPDESAKHQCTWMAFGASEENWGRELLSGVQDNLAAIARAIVKYEPVKMLVREEDYDIAAQKCGSEIELIITPLDDLWMRDMGPVFVIDEEGRKAGIDFNFNGWGEKQEYDRDAEVASFVAQYSNVPRISTNLIFEGGGIEVDGRGTAIVTESCILNRNRNPGLSKEDCEAELKALLGLKKIIWLPGIAGYDITDGHTDFYARFARPGIVIAALETDPTFFDYTVTQQHLDILRSATDAEGNKLEVFAIENPTKIRPGFESDEFAAGYINFYVINGAVIAPEFGDTKADRHAKNVLEKLFPDRTVVQLNIDYIAVGGGGIHCTTQQEPFV